MGFSYSPRWAASLGWVVILHKEANDPDSLGVYETWGPNPPPFVRLRESPDGRTIGFVFLWLDNVMVITNNQSLRDRWYHRLEANAQHFKCIWKKDSFIRTNSPCYLGIYFRKVKDKLLWCHETARIQKWKELLGRKILTPRDVSRHIGVAQWHQMISLEPLYVIGDAIDIGRRISRHMNSKSNWDTPLADLGLSLPEKDIRTLRQFVRAALRNPDCTWNTLLPAATIFACKEDQSKLDLAKNARVRLGRPDNGAGAIVYGNHYHPTNNSSDFQSPVLRWTDKERLQDIHILETRAVKWLLQDILPVAAAPTRLVVGSDSTIAVAAISKGYSSCPKTRREVKAIFELCASKNYILEILWIPGIDNAADPVSRGHDANTMLNARTWELLHGSPSEHERQGRPPEPPFFSDEDYHELTDCDAGVESLHAWPSEIDLQTGDSEADVPGSST